MQLASTPRPMRDLHGVGKTLRHVYPPLHEFSPAITRALEALARRETHIEMPAPAARELASVS